MSCEGMQTLIQGYADGELDLLDNLRAEEHLKDCAVCARDLQNHQALRLAFAGGSLYFSAPPTVRARIRSAVRASGNAKPTPSSSSWRWMALAASFALLAIALSNLVLLRSRPSRDELLAQEIVAGHVRSMMAGHLRDVASSDQHTVKPWFDGKLDFAPPVQDLAPRGFPLVGGRLDYVGRRPVAALVFQRRQHPINLFVWPSPDESDDKDRIVVRQGYDLIHWSRAGMVYWAVSDLNLNELQEFAQALQSSASRDDRRLKR